MRETSHAKAQRRKENKRMVFFAPLRLCVRCFFGFLFVASLLAADQPSLPKDTLPAALSLDDVPLGLGSRPVPKNNPLTAAKVALGRRLFFDPVLSADRTVACASCHQPEHGFASPDGRPR